MNTEMAHQIQEISFHKIDHDSDISFFRSKKDDIQQIIMNISATEYHLGAAHSITKEVFEKVSNCQLDYPRNDFISEYFDTSKLTVSSLVKYLEAISVEQTKFQASQAAKSGVLYFSVIVAAILMSLYFAVACYGIFGYWANSNSEFQDYTTFIAWVSAIIGFYAFAYGFQFFIDAFLSRKAKKLVRNGFSMNKWPDFIAMEDDVILLQSKIHNLSMEATSRLDERKALEKVIKARQIDDHFEGKKSARFIVERLAIIEAEAKRAIETAKNLEEEHRLTEAVRTKYEKEMIEYAKDARNTNDQAFMDKLSLVESLLSGDSK